MKPNCSTGGKRLYRTLLAVLFAVALWFSPSLLVFGLHLLRPAVALGFLGGQAAVLVFLALLLRTRQYMYCLTKDFSWESDHLGRRLSMQRFPKELVCTAPSGLKCLKIERSGRITVFTGYAWDGCTPKFSLGGVLIFGTYDGDLVGNSAPPELRGEKAAYYASLVHDALYQFLGELELHGLTKCDADLIFFELLKATRFGPRLLYFRAVDLFGHGWRKVVHEGLRRPKTALPPRG